MMPGTGSIAGELHAFAAVPAQGALNVGSVIGMEWDISVEWSGVRWSKSRRSGADGCVEYGPAADVVGLRDSKDALSPVLAFSHPAWRSFIDDVKRGAYDRPHRT
jgi:Domain of unknown function (DUF397)